MRSNRYVARLRVTPALTRPEEEGNVMPRMVAHELTWRQVKDGDALDDRGDRYVETIVKRTKYAFVTYNDDPDGRPEHRMLLDDQTTVWRQELTNAERQAEMRRWTRDAVVDTLAKSLKSPPVKKLAELVDQVYSEHRDGEQSTNVLTWSNMVVLLQTQAKFKVARHVVAFLGDVKLEDATYDQLVTALARWRNRVAERYPTDPLSRSTSTTANLLDDMDRWAEQDLLHSLEYGAIRSDVDDRVHELRRK